MPSSEEIEKFLSEAIKAPRFLITDDDDRPRSSTWFFQTTGDNVYLGPRGTGGKAKLSFHPPGSGRDGCDSQWGLVRQYAEEESTKGFTDLLKPVRWVRPAAPTKGAVIVASIAFPADYMKGAVAPSEGTGKRIAFPLAPAGQATVIDIFFAREAPEKTEQAFIASGRTPFIYSDLPCGEFVSLTARQVPFDSGYIPQGSWTSGVKPMSGAPQAGESAENLHATLVVGRPETGRPIQLIEVNGLSLTRTEPEQP